MTLPNKTGDPLPRDTLAVAPDRDKAVCLLKGRRHTIATGGIDPFPDDMPAERESVWARTRFGVFSSVRTVDVGA
jgi:hypothetical protein